MEVMLLISFKIQENELKKYMIDISKGNELALEQFYEKYGQLLLALIYSIVKNRESSEEALQDVLMAIVNRNADNPMENARGWLFKLMHSESLSDYEDTLIEYDMTSNIEETVDQIEALKILDEFEQEVLIMCVFGHMKLPYIAESLNMPYDKVRSKYDYAIRKLKRYYGGRKKV